MPRALVLGNGSMLATFDEFLQLRDFYYPHVGEEDHTTFGKFHRVGFFVEGLGFSWTNDGSWKITVGYNRDSLVSQSTLVNERLKLQITSEDCVDPTRTILLRSFKISSLDGAERVVRCFFHHDFHLYGMKQKDTAFYEPHTNSVIHYQQRRYFLVGGTASDPVNCPVSEAADGFHPFGEEETHIDHCGLTSFSIGKSNYRGLEGTWRDAEDGMLSRSAIEQGSVDSTVEIDCLIPQGRESTVSLWVCAGETIGEVHALQHSILAETPEQIKQTTRNYWRGWVGSHADPTEFVPPRVADLYRRSLLTIRTQADNHGGIVAANDNDIMQFNRDTYTYVWPRDGAFVSMSLVNAGQGELARRFLEFCARVQTKDGYFLHKYNPDGSSGSSWHPWIRGNQSVLPIQGDETALPLLALWHHFKATQDFEFLHSLYQSFVKHAADFLCEYTDEVTGLPLASYDLWEEHRGIFSYTTACTIAGIRAAAEIAGVLGQYTDTSRYSETADKMAAAMLFHLYDEETQCFMKKIKLEHGKILERDTTPDASIALLWQLGVVPFDDPRMASTIKRLEETLKVQSGIGGYARYTVDHYQSVGAPTKEVPGNPWIITTLWMAQWHIANAATLEELEKQLPVLEWVCDRASPAGILAEQMNPFTGAPLSVAPLTWSHAVFLDAVLQYAARHRELSGL